MEQEHLSKFQKFEQSYFTKGKIWMYTGLSIIIFGLVLGTIRSINDLNLANLLVLGTVNPDGHSGLLTTATGSAQQAITIETVISHSTEQLLLLAMSLFKLAIGGFIFLIVQQLVATRRYVMAKAKASGVPVGPEPKTPMFAKLFPLLLVLGTDIQFINVGVLMSIWDLNALNILNMQFSGTASGAAFQSAVFIEKLIGSLVVPVEMAGATLMLTGIPLGLATIVVNLRMQGRMLPLVFSDIMARKMARMPVQPIMALGSSGTPRSTPDLKQMMTGIESKGVVAFTMIGFLLGISGLIVFAPIRAANVATLVSESFTQTMSAASIAGLKLYDGFLAITVEQALFIALGIVVFAINIFLLQIIKALRAQRKFLGETLESTTGTRVTTLEKPLWPTRAALVTASIGFGLMILNFIFALVADNANATGDALTAGAFAILVKTVKLTAFGFLLTGVGLSLINIMVNLQLTARTLPNFFGKMLQFAQNGRGDHGTVELPRPMSLAPWKLFYVILAGTVITIFVTFPLILVEVQSFLTWKTLALAGDTTSAAYSSALLTDRLIDAAQLPLKLFGMGLMLFGIGRTFSVILGFVKARRQLISEGVDSLLAVTA
jgi:hypothetical protein